MLLLRSAYQKRLLPQVATAAAAATGGGGGGSGSARRSSSGSGSAASSGYDSGSDSLLPQQPSPQPRGKGAQQSQRDRHASYRCGRASSHACGCRLACAGSQQDRGCMSWALAVPCATRAPAALPTAQPHVPSEELCCRQQQHSAGRGGGAGRKSGAYRWQVAAPRACRWRGCWFQAGSGGNMPLLSTVRMHRRCRRRPFLLHHPSPSSSSALLRRRGQIAAARLSCAGAARWSGMMATPSASALGFKGAGSLHPLC